MSIVAKETGGADFAPPEEGLFAAVCDMLVDLGDQPSPKKEYGVKHQIYVRWQLPDQRIEMEQDGITTDLPMVIGKFYTLSLHTKANLRGDLEKWRGKAFTAEELYGFELDCILATPCMVLIEHSPKQDGGIQAKVANVMRYKGKDKPKVEGDALQFDFDENYSNLKKLPEWLQKKIAGRVREEKMPPDDSPDAGAVENPGYDDPSASDGTPPF